MRKGRIRKRYRLLFVTLSMLFTITAFGQNKVTGHVTDATTGQPVQSVTVTVSGAATATQTAADGSYSINVAPDGILVFTSVSYVTETVPVGGQSVVDVQMHPLVEKLADVVVSIGYGTARKKDLTGSVTQVSSSDFQSGQITTPEQLISGKVAGVQITSNGGAPGAGSTIRIRGGASLNASNDPLIVIDGVPLSGSGIAGSPNALGMINPDDIESFTVLKDASATAIYGSRASNGVIIITTKTGRPGGKPRFNFNSTFSVSEIAGRVDVYTPDEYRNLVRKYGTQAQIDLLGTANTDWQKAIYQTALTTDNNFSVSGGLKNLPYRVSVGYLSQEGILKTSKLDRYSALVNLSPRLLDNHLKIDFSLKGTISKSRFANTGAIGAAVYFDPTKPIYSDNNNYNGYWEWLDPDPSSATGLKELAPRNPVGLLQDYHNNSNVKRSVGNALIDYKVHFLPDLHAFLNVGYDYAWGEGTVKVDPNAAQSYKRSPDKQHGGVDNKYQQERQDKLLEAYLNYTKDISGIDTRIELVGGYAYQDFLTINHSFPDLTSDGFVMSTPTFTIDSPRYTLMSYYGRGNFNIKDRYLLTGTIRTDGSSRFAKDQRWGIFPSGAFAWNLKNENFLDNSKVVSAMKLRVGYGLTGQQSGIGLYDYTSFYGYSSNESQYQLGNTFYHMYAPGGFYPQRTWEKTATTNLGLDFGFFDNRISGSIDAYYKKTTDLLNMINQPAGSNFSNEIIANVGSMENRGIEVSLNLQPVKNANVVWDLALNGTYNKNEITNLTAVPSPDFPGNPYGGIGGGTGNTILINSVGRPRGSFYVYRAVYGTDGLPIDGLFADLNRDGSINQQDLYQYQSVDPQYLFGASTNVNIRKNLNFGFVMRASVGNYVYNNNITGSTNLKNILNPLGYLTNTIGYYLVSGNGDRYFLSDFYVQNASFIKMDNIYVNYAFRNVFRTKSTLTLNANLQNVFTITNYIGLDPEVQGGIDNTLYPRPRTMSLGLNLNF
ncbi:MAG: SusC/RagA family TonB-linked outer membrane protein [Chitinophagaceae bacterium]|nr:SusC/RagA family TonB-linked outer membrane protein [Chitinophagaceae bacterium]MCW5915127.1 SusC/RagA family TonB-linked outer membrane protein [Chitinophagaceae bacterium]MCZ2396534.1 SusC/RagA family TonB-linked outer membrane protein [Chitinophagales bacterium]